MASGWAAQDRRLDLSKPCIRVGPSARSPWPPRGLPAEHAARVRRIVGQDGYATRQAVYGLRKLPRAANRQTRQNSPLPGPPDEAVTIEPVTMTCDSSCRGSSGLAESILTGLGREVRMSLRAPDIADLGFQVGDHIRFTNTASSVRDRNPGGLVPGEGTLHLFTADEALSDECLTSQFLGDP
jgi:hypothetical protein